MTDAKRKLAIACYVPALHQGYWQFFEKIKLAYESEFSQIELLLLDHHSLLEYLPTLKKELRVLDSELLVKAVKSWQQFPSIRLITAAELAHESLQYELIIMPDDDISAALAPLMGNAKIKLEPIFLRYDRKNSLAENVVAVAANESLAKIMQLANAEAAKSSDWWRQVGAVIFDETTGQLLSAGHNQHLPSSYHPDINGDARGSFSKGDHIELTTAIHAEANLIATAAKNGKSLLGKSLYSSTFPCPPCAKLIAASGINKLYFQNGYAMLDGEEVLKNAGVEIIRLSPL